MIKKTFLAVAAIIIIFLIVVAVQPNEFKVERSATIAAAPDVLFEFVNVGKKFEQWNPWDKLDPNIKNTYSGPPSGVGAACTWSGNDEVGAGTSTIIESRPNELIRQKLEMTRPMASTCTVEFTFKPDGDKTVVTWKMFGPQPFIGKAMSLFIDCDKMCGDQFEMGLKELEVVAQAASK